MRNFERQKNLPVTGTTGSVKRLLLNVMGCLLSIWDYVKATPIKVAPVRPHNKRQSNQIYSTRRLSMFSYSKLTPGLGRAVFLSAVPIEIILRQPNSVRNSKNR